jgi:GT2 family glycosyltransferase
VLLTEPRPGSYVARNTAIDASKGELLAFTDADCLPSIDWLEALVLAAPDDRTIVAGNIELFPRDPLNPSPSERLDMFWNFRQDRFVADGWGATANLAMARSIYDTVGPFDASQFSGGDHEWCLRAKALGYRIRYAADARIRHPARATWQQLSTQTRRYTGGIFFRSKAKPGPHRAHALYLLTRPPLRRLFQAAAAPGLGSAIERAQIAGILVTLRFVALVEWLRLALGSQRERR